MQKSYFSDGKELSPCSILVLADSVISSIRIGPLSERWLIGTFAFLRGIIKL